MIPLKVAIFIVGLLQAGLLPYAIKKALKHVALNLNTQTLSFLSNKSLYGKKLVKGYKWVLFGTAILTYTFFWLLTQYYELGSYSRFLQYIDLGFASLTLLAFVPHNIKPYSLKSLAPSIQRFMHNVLSVIVFVALPALIIAFQITILTNTEMIFLGVSGLVIIVITVLSVALTMLKNGINGAAELLFINGVGFWTVFIASLTFIK